MGIADVYDQCEPGLTFFIGFVFTHFLSIWHEEGIIQQLKA
jgi:hypothetical protein